MSEHISLDIAGSDRNTQYDGLTWSSSFTPIVSSAVPVVSPLVVFTVSSVTTGGNMQTWQTRTSKNAPGLTREFPLVFVVLRSAAAGATTQTAYTRVIYMYLLNVHLSCHVRYTHRATELVLVCCVRRVGRRCDVDGC